MFKNNAFLIWAICILLLGILTSLRLFGDDTSKTSGVAQIILGVIAILYVLSRKKN